MGEQAAMQRHFITSIVASWCVSTAVGALRGGIVLTNDEWNGSASASIGEAVTVTRMYTLFDEPDDILRNMQLSNQLFGGGFDAIRSRAGAMFYQSEFGSDNVGGITPAFIDIFPDVEWDSFLTMGATQRSERFPSFGVAGLGAIEFGPNAIQLPAGTDNNSWLLFPRVIDGVLEYPGQAGGPLGFYDADSGLYGMLIAQVTLFGVHDEFRSISSAVLSDDVFASRLFEGGVIATWFDDLSKGQLSTPLRFAIPTPSVLPLFGLAGVVASRRRR